MMDRWLRSAKVLHRALLVDEDALRIALHVDADDHEGHPLRRPTGPCRRWRPIAMSTWPASMIWGTRTPGPPGTMSTSMPGIPVVPLGQRLVEAPVLGLGIPVGLEPDLRQGRDPVCGRGAAGGAGFEHPARASARAAAARTPRDRNESWESASIVRLAERIVPFVQAEPAERNHARDKDEAQEAAHGRRGEEGADLELGAVDDGEEARGPPALPRSCRQRRRRRSHRWSRACPRS